MKRIFDFCASLLGLIILAPLMAVIAVLVRVDSPGPVLHLSRRFGRDATLFDMPKFRSMKTGTPNLPTHKLENAESHVTRLGRILRKTSLDELPQLWSVLKGDMSFVGPRPALFNQDDLMAMRREAGVIGLVPGITGWAQINGRDALSLKAKVAFEREYASKRSLSFDLRIIALTIIRAVRTDSIAH
ncbi:sugar transferase [Pseudopontixanthobacter vadosimaris]|uniref:sugar transferase n=1 Tax=Pseudopontixanthobacter vadosimaris TaxID=2726450 RepID=UPI0014752586